MIPFNVVFGFLVATVFFLVLGSFFAAAIMEKRKTLSLFWATFGIFSSSLLFVGVSFFNKDSSGSDFAVCILIDALCYFILGVSSFQARALPSQESGASYRKSES
ncbi:hypothetical protein AGMMS49949_04200 [Alphaproteobacteria bacterium]|nr:hypothetical protein AGMMS49949_04200 [Alphaproteobacteria bacterium]GHS97126.1 hypothetical protein AGMMS50296_3850 [Alphaproteobacteria bacterium]